MIRPRPARPPLAPLLLGLLLTLAWPELRAEPQRSPLPHPLAPLAGTSVGRFELADHQGRGRTWRAAQERRRDRDEHYDRDAERATPSPQRQQRIEERRRRFESLPPQQQQRLLEARDRFQRLPPEQRTRLREKWRELPPEERRRWRDSEQRDRD